MEPKYSLLEAKQKLEAYCAYQERCEFEIIQKLRTWNIYSEDIPILIADLITNNFLNEQRFASAYVSGKFRIKNWGRNKIKQHLKQKNISSYSINEGMKEIDPDEYYDTLKKLAENKTALINGKSIWEKRAKLQRYLNSKGYENDLIHAVMKEVLS
jgi:regulatory protein